MEIGLAFLLFFGGFAVGTLSDDETGEDTSATTVRPHADDAPATSQATRLMRPSDPIRCEVPGTAIYRDLTLPIGHPNRPQPGEAGGREGTRPDD